MREPRGLFAKIGPTKDACSERSWGGDVVGEAACLRCSCRRATESPPNAVRPWSHVSGIVADDREITSRNTDGNDIRMEMTSVGQKHRVKKFATAFVDFISFLL